MNAVLVLVFPNPDLAVFAVARLSRDLTSDVLASQGHPKCTPHVSAPWMVQLYDYPTVLNYHSSKNNYRCESLINSENHF